MTLNFSILPGSLCELIEGTMNKEKHVSKNQLEHIFAFLGQIPYPAIQVGSPGSRKVISGNSCLHDTVERSYNFTKAETFIH